MVSIVKREHKINVYQNLASYDVNHDWIAVDDNLYGGEAGDPIGYGKTPREAINDLLDALDME